MGQRDLVVPNAGGVLLPLGGYLSSGLFRNTSATTNATVDIYFGPAGEPGVVKKRLNPGEILVVDPWDTSIRDGTGKICTTFIYIAGNAVASVTVECGWATKAVDQRTIEV